MPLTLIVVCPSTANAMPAGGSIATVTNFGTFGLTWATPIPLPGIPAGTPMDQLVAPQFATGGKLSDQSAMTSIPLPARWRGFSTEAFGSRRVRPSTNPMKGTTRSSFVPKR